MPVVIDTHLPHVLWEFDVIHPSSGNFHGVSWGSGVLTSYIIWHTEPSKFQILSGGLNTYVVRRNSILEGNHTGIT